MKFLLFILSILSSNGIWASSETTCVQQMMQTYQFKESEAFQICQIHSPVSQVCVKDIISRFPTLVRESAVKLCVLGSSPGTGDCFRKATVNCGLEEPKSVELCSRSQSEAPAECYRNIILVGGITSNIAIQTCVNAADTRPVQCARDALLLQGLSVDQVPHLCATPFKIPKYIIQN